MRMFLISILTILAPVSLIFGGCGESGNKKSAKKNTLTIAVIPKGTTHEFWKSIHAGAVKAAVELKVDIIWKGPHQEDDRELQIQVVEDFISTNVDGIVLAPLDDRALMPAVKEAKKMGITTVIIDSELKGEDFVSFIATDNYKGGRLGAQRLSELLNGKGKVIMLRCMEGSASSTKREEGFLDEITSKYPDIEILSSNQYAGATTEKAYQKSESLLNRFPDVDGIFCPNESTTFGMLRAIQDAGFAGKVFFVGFDSSEKLVQALREDVLHGLVLQNPFRMGEMGVYTIVDHLRGKIVTKRIDTGVTMVTKENMDQPGIKKLILPELDRYLSGSER